MIDKYLQGVYDEYQVDQTNLIRNIKNNLPFILLSPFELIHKRKGRLFYNSCMRSPRKVTEHESTDRKSNCILRTPIQYSQTWKIKNQSLKWSEEKCNKNQVDDIDLISLI